MHRFQGLDSEVRPCDVGEDGVEGGRGVQIALQHEVAEAGVVVQRYVAACA